MTRFIPKQFAENSTTSVVFGSHQEQGGNVGDGTISSDPATLQGGTAWPLGWSAATDNFFKIPRGEEMEGLERVLSAAIIQQFKDGLTFWQSEMPVTQYQTIVQYQTGSDHPKLYVNITGDSTSTPPDSDATNWFMFCDTAQVLANVSLTNSPYTTNRIIEIPQDIKLELNNGTLTLKTGSKVYVPNGFEEDGTTPKFDVLYVDTDKEPVFLSSLTQRYLFYLSEDYPTYNNCYMTPAVCSGGTDTLLGTPWHIWFDTPNNIIRVSDDGTTYLSVTASLPLSVCTVNDTQTVSIDQIFNGFGYIGSTVFALPDIKVQGAFGVNEDGTYKLKEFVTDHVLTALFNLNVSGNYSVGFDVVENGTIPYFGSYANEIKVGEKQPSGLNFAWWNPIKGETRYVNNSGITENTPYTSPRLGRVNVSGGRIDSMVQNPIDSIVTSNALNFSQAGRSYLSGLGIETTTGAYLVTKTAASETDYTAPTNGIFKLNCKSNAAGRGYCQMYNVTQYTNTSGNFFIQAGQYFNAGTNNDWFRATMKVKKGDTIRIQYSNCTMNVNQGGLFFFPLEGEV